MFCCVTAPDFARLLVEHDETFPHGGSAARPDTLLASTFLLLLIALGTLAPW